MIWVALAFGNLAAIYGFTAAVLDKLAPEPAVAVAPSALPRNVVVLAEVRRRRARAAA